MNRYPSIKQVGNRIYEKIKHSPLLKSLLLNITYLLGMLLFYEPYMGNDDTAMSEIVYGVFSGNYSYHVIYENFIYGRILVFLLEIFPNIPWYTVLFYLWVFLALSLLTYIVLSHFDWPLGMILSNILLLFFAYEGYVTIQFTIIAGIAGAVGFFLLLYPSTPWQLKLLGAALFFISCLIRYEIPKMIIGAWICSFVFIFLWQFLFSSKIKIKRVHVIGLVIGIIIFLLVPRLPQYSSVEEKETWSKYWSFSSARSLLQDYECPSYKENEQSYQKLGISENDIYIWHSWNNDTKCVTPELATAVTAIGADNAMDNVTSNKFIGFFQKYTLSSILNYFKHFPTAFFSIDVFWAFVLIIIILAISFHGEKCSLIEIILIPSITLLALNYYLFIKGRYLQHRVDVSIFLTVITIMLFLAHQSDNRYMLPNKQRFCVLILSLFLIILATTHSCYAIVMRHANLTSNKLFFEQTEVDADTCYFFVAKRPLGDLENQGFYNPFEVPKIASGHNRFYSSYNMYDTLCDTSRYQKYNINYIYSDIVDADNILLVLCQTDDNESQWEQYFTEHSGKKAELQLVKKFFDKKIYRVVSEPLEKNIDIQTIQKEGKVVSTVKNLEIKNKKCYFEGVAYLDETSGFGQETYLQIIDSTTDMSQLYYTLQTCDKTKSYGEDGYFANISAEIELPDYFDDTDKICLLIKENDLIYSVSLK